MQVTPIILYPGCRSPQSFCTQDAGHPDHSVPRMQATRSFCTRTQVTRSFCTRTQVTRSFCTRTQVTRSFCTQDAGHPDHSVLGRRSPDHSVPGCRSPDHSVPGRRSPDHSVPFTNLVLLSSEWYSNSQNVMRFSILSATLICFIIITRSHSKLSRDLMIILFFEWPL